MKALFRNGPGQSRLVERDYPRPRTGEVTIKLVNTGICGSDIHRFSDADPKWDKVVLGHEFAGIIHEKGEDVANLQVGWPVVAAPLLPCHSCVNCARGDYSLCEHYSFLGSRQDGGFAEFVRVPASNVLPLPANLELSRAAFIEPITVCLHPIMRLENLIGKTVAVTGLGAIGLLAVQIFRIMGARNIVASDVFPGKLALARELGATHLVNVTEESLEESVEQLGGADVIFESSGNNKAKQSAIQIASERGKIILVGTSPKDISFPATLFERITRKELSLVGSWMNYSAPWPGPEWQTARWLLGDERIQVDPLITHSYALDKFQSALDLMFTKPESFVKIMIEI